MPKVEPAVTSGSDAASGRQSPDSQEILVRASPITERVPSLPNGVDNSAVQEDAISPVGEIGNLGEACGEVPPWLDEQAELSRSGRSGPTGLAEDDGQVAVESETRSDQTKWSDEEIEKLKALYPTHSASAIAEQLGRRFNAVRAKARHLGSRKDGPPTVTAKPAKPAPKPRSLSAAVTTDPNDVLLELVRTPVPHGFSAVALLDHRPGQCRWIISDGCPVMYCRAPVVDCSSWCEQHSKRVLNTTAKPGRVPLPKYRW